MENGVPLEPKFPWCANQYTAEVRGPDGKARVALMISKTGRGDWDYVVTNYQCYAKAEGNTRTEESARRAAENHARTMLDHDDAEAAIAEAAKEMALKPGDIITEDLTPKAEEGEGHGTTA